jgi:hypothetical protein
MKSVMGTREAARLSPVAYAKCWPMECWAGCGSTASGSSPNRQSSASSCPEDQARGLPGSRLQVAQYPVERLLVGVVVLPSPEVADVA